MIQPTGHQPAFPATMVAYSATRVATQITTDIQGEGDFLRAIGHAVDTLNDGDWTLVTRSNNDGREIRARRDITVGR